MGLMLFAGIWLLNVAISTWNAYTCGKSWHVAKGNAIVLLVLGSGLVMAVAGFTWTLSLAFAWIAVAAGKLDPVYATMMIDLAYVMLIVPVVAAGFVITLHSITVAMERRDGLSIGIAMWNVLAQASNTISLFRYLPKALGSAGSLFKSKSARDSGATMIVLVLIVLALFGGLLLTAVIFEKGRADARRELEPAYA